MNPDSLTLLLVGAPGATFVVLGLLWPRLRSTPIAQVAAVKTAMKSQACQ